MTEQQARSAATRGRSSTRGGRGGYGSRGGHRAGNKTTNGDHNDVAPVDQTADQGELGDLKKRYSSQLTTLRELFPDWTDVDFVMALQETDGDLQATIERITEGNVNQFAEIKKKSKDRSRSKAKDASAAGNEVSMQSRPIRGAKGAADGGRGGRGRGERGRGNNRVPRGGGQSTANGLRHTGAAASVPTAESSAWDTTASGDGSSGWDQTNAAPVGDGSRDTQAGTVPEADKGEPDVRTKTVMPDTGPKKTWASMFAQPKLASPPAKPVAKPQQPVEPQAIPGRTPSAQNEVGGDIAEIESFARPPATSDSEPMEKLNPDPPSAVIPDVVLQDAESKLSPSKDELTEDNLEHVPDSSGPALTETAASTVASSRDPGPGTPSSGLQQAPIQRPPMGSYAASALRSANQGRSASFQKRFMEQQEAVVMPSNHAVDRAAVQFGSMGLNGNAEADGLDVDEDREDAETRTQPPQHSPPSQPKASLPPAQRQTVLSTDAPVQDVLPTPKPNIGLPPAPVQQAQVLGQQQAAQEAPLPPAIAQHGSQNTTQYGQLGRYGQSNSQLEPVTATQKQFDPFGQSGAGSNQFDGHPNHTQAPSQPQQHAPSQVPYSSAPLDQPSYYSSEYQRNAYQNYYGGSYGGQGSSAQQDAGLSQQRTSSGFGAASADSMYPGTQAQQSQSRYAEAPNSGGQTTPNPLMLSQSHSGSQAQQSQHVPQQPHHTQSGHSGHPYGHPYYSSPYFNTYMNQYGYGGQGYGGPYGGKGGMYGQPHHGYGMSPQTSYDQHSSSPGNVSGFGQSSMHGRESALASGLGDYGRSGSAQPSQNHQTASTASSFGTMPDILGRSHSGLPGQNQQFSHQQAGPQNSAEDPLKPFGEAKTTTGAPGAPSLTQPGRPGSATNTAAGQSSQSGMPPSQAHQPGFGSYSGHLNHLQSGQASQYAGLSGLGGHQGGAQSHQGGGYGGYGTGFGNSYGNYSRGGWGGNYGH